MPISTTLYLQYAALSLLIVGELVAAASWAFVEKSADSAARLWFASVAMQLLSGMVLFTAGTEFREAAYFVAAIIQFSSLYLALYSTTLMLRMEVKRTLLAVWTLHFGVFAVLYHLLDQPSSSFAVSMISVTVLEIMIVWHLRQVRKTVGLMATLFAEVAFGAAVLGGLTRLFGSWVSGNILLYTDLSYYSVIAMSLQCVLIVMACFFYIGISIQRAEARELAMRVEADQLRLRQHMAEKHARETQKLIGERDRMMILNSRFSAVSTLSLLGAGVVHEITQPLQAARSAMDVLAMHKRLSQKELAHHISGLLKLMATVDVVIIRRQEARATTSGINLMDVLTLQFGSSLINSERTRVSDRLSGSTISDAVTTSQNVNLTIPSVTYSLNIANAMGNNSSIEARQTLLVYNGVTSKVFSGGTLTYAASGQMYYTSQLWALKVGPVAQLVRAGRS